MNVNTFQLDSLVSQIENVSLPESYCRVLFYFFGHGNEESVKLADEYVERQYIISKLQVLSPPDSNIYTIFVFDSCRKVDEPTCVALQESSYFKALAGEAWKSKGQYPDSSNTLVINATNFNCKAYYRVTDGCGLMTYHLTELASTRNESLSDLLVAVRKRMAKETQNITQILVYEDKLMGTVNLLAESQGTARVAPTNVYASPSILSTNIHWKFADNVQEKIKIFRVEISPGAVHPVAQPHERVTTIKALSPSTSHTVRVIAVYEDDTKTTSENCVFTTPARDAPSAVAVTPEYGGSPRAKISWSFPGESSDLIHFRVVIQPEGLDVISSKAPSSNRDIVAKGFLPSMIHKVSVIAVYHDGEEVNQNIEFRHHSRMCPTGINITPEFDGSPNATVVWSFNGVHIDLSHFNVVVKPEGGKAVCDCVTKLETQAILRELKPATKHTVSVIAVYSDGIQNPCSIQYTHKDRSSPEGIKVTQRAQGSNQATITWNFPPIPLSQFFLKITEQKTEQTVTLSVASQERQANVYTLKQATKYDITVVAIYNDGKEQRCCVEYTNCELKAANIESTSLTRIREGNLPTAVFKICWSYHVYEPLLAVDHFRVIASPRAPDPEKAGSDTVRERMDNPSCTSAELSLELGTTYSVSIVTHFADKNIKPQSSRDVEVTSPALSEVIHVLKITDGNITRKSVTFEVIPPPMLQSNDHTKVDTVEYAINEEPTDGENILRQESVFKQCDSAESHLALPTQQQPIRVKVNNLKTERKVRANYNTGDTILGNEIEFETRPQTVGQRICLHSTFLFGYMFLLFVLLSSLLLVASYPVYITKLQGREQFKTVYILTLDSVQCGEGSSQKYSEIVLEGSQEQGDTILGVLQAWRVNKNDLDVKTRKLPPVLDGSYISDRERVLLNGWQIYTWENSVISGFCCLTNNDSHEQTSSLHMFMNDEDIINFINGQEAQNMILSDSITIPPKSTQCFQTWGRDSPFKVRQSSYHFIGIDAPAATTFTSNITVLQRYADTSTYGTPQYFRFDNSTRFSLPGEIYDPNDYVIICKAPDYESVSISKSEYGFLNSINGASPLKVTPLTVGAESLHIHSHNEVHHWMKKTFPVLLGLGLLGSVVSVIAFFMACSYHWKCLRCRLKCKCSKQRNAYQEL